MHKQIYVNLPVSNLERSKAFFTELGFSFNSQFTDDKAACMVVNDNIYVMLLMRDFFQTFTWKPVADARAITEVLVCLSADSRGEIDALVAKALAAGGAAPNPPQDHGFMYAHGFEDLDGHLWELAYMEPQSDGQG
ncbi:MAG TPA: VOC family protein [Noviherbaspirillum sp.]|jgi:predicted lactoylglutathione lyase|uniref:VOC family protein n=1 Tax=Noviherbaspirillum sp. TaxID=1926288 RepID=UPI002F9292AF